MRSRQNFTMAAADPDGIAESQTLGAAGNLTLDGALSGILAVPRHISLTSAGDISGVTFTITGTDRYGNPKTESLAGPAATTVTTVGNFSTVSQVAASAAVASAVTVGSADEADLAWIPCNLRAQAARSVQVIHTGSSTYSLEFSLAPTANIGEDVRHPLVHTGMSAKTASAVVHPTETMSAMRIAISSYVSGSLIVRMLEPVSPP